MEMISKKKFNEINFERMEFKRKNVELKKLLKELLGKNKEVADWLEYTSCPDEWIDGCAERTANKFLFKDIKEIKKRLKTI